MELGDLKPIKFINQCKKFNKIKHKNRRVVLEETGFSIEPRLFLYRSRTMLVFIPKLNLKKFRLVCNNQL